MPPGEEMFKFHGYSGNCPKARPKPKPIQALVQYRFRDEGDEYWIDIKVDGDERDGLGPFATAGERQRAFDDLMAMTRSQGAQTLPNFKQ